MKHGRTRFIAIFLALPLLLFGVFVLYPYAQGVVMSFTDWSGYSGEKEFIGFANYVELVGDARFWSALSHNAIYLVVLPPLTLGLALFFAVLTSIGGGRGGRVGPIAGSGIYRAIFFFPNILPIVMALVLWQFVFNPRIGLLNGVLEAVGLGHLAQSWLGDPNTAPWAILGVLIWGQVGFYYVLFSASIQGIPREYFEAAQLDGIGRIRMFWSITLPMMLQTIQVAWIYIGMFALDMFVTVAVLTPGGGPSGSTEVIATYMQRLAFSSGRFGYSATIGVVLTVLTLVFAFITFRLTRRERLEY